MNLRRSILSLVVLSLSVVPILPGCGSDDGDTTPDAGTTTDAGTRPDSGTTPDAGPPPDSGTDQDAGTTTDAGTELDAGTTTDAGTELDAGTTTDAGTELDAGTTPDAGTEPDAGTTPDAGAEPDAGTTPDAGTEPDAGTTPDAGAEPDAGTPPDFTTCEGTCQATSTTAQMYGNQVVLNNAYFGYAEPANAGAPWSLWIELSNGTPDECPSETSPVPPQLATLELVKVPVDTTPETGSPTGGPTSVLFDFDGALMPEFAVRGTGLTFTPVAASLCPSCVKAGTPPAKHFVAFDVNVTYANGTVSGHGYATYCPSMNTLQDN